MTNKVQVGVIKNHYNSILFFINELNFLGDGQKVQLPHCITLPNKLSTNRIFVLEKEKKNILKITFKLVIANKKSPQNIYPFLGYPKASCALIILKITQAKPSICQYQRQFSCDVAQFKNIDGGDTLTSLPLVMIVFFLFPLFFLIRGLSNIFDIRGI